MDDEERMARMVDEWYNSRAGRELFRLQKALITRLLKPLPGERLLDVGCGTGRHLQFFRREGLQVTGLDSSAVMLDRARLRLGKDADLRPGRAEDLPFEDNEFDVVTLIYCLAGLDAPKEALAEAFRVARRGVFIGANNVLSLEVTGWRVKNIWRREGRKPARSGFTVWELLGMVREIGGPMPVRWATLGTLPGFLAARAASFEAYPLVQRSPFGAFIGLAVDMACTWRTDNMAAAARGLTAVAPATPASTAFTPVQAGLGQKRLDRTAVEVRP